MKKRQAGIIGAAGAAVILCGILLIFILKFRREKALSISVIGGRTDQPPSFSRERWGTVFLPFLWPSAFSLFFLPDWL